MKDLLQTCSVGAVPRNLCRRSKHFRPQAGRHTLPNGGFAESSVNFAECCEAFGMRGHVRALVRRDMPRGIVAIIHLSEMLAIPRGVSRRRKAATCRRTPRNFGSGQKLANGNNEKGGNRSSAELDSAVSRICNPLAAANGETTGHGGGVPNAIRRYSGLQIRATCANRKKL
jgi:hypothetical protein